MIGRSRKPVVFNAAPAFCGNQPADGLRLTRRTREITTDAIVSDHRRPRRFPDRRVDRPGAGDRLEALADGVTLLRVERQVREMVDRWPMGLTGSDNAHPWRPQRPPKPQRRGSEKYHYPT